MNVSQNEVKGSPEEVMSDAEVAEKAHSALMRALARVSSAGREKAIERLQAQRIDQTGERQARLLGHRAVGFYGALAARKCGMYYFPPCSLGVAGPRGPLP